MRRILSVLLVFCAIPAQAGTIKAGQASLVEPSLRLVAHQGRRPRVALTLDACSGKVDYRILDFLVKEKIPATLFVTTRWLKRNGAAIAVLKANPNLFEIEDHGREHLAVVDRPMAIYGVKAVGSPEGVALEVSGGAEAILAAGFPQPKWFRGATAKYSTSAVSLVEGMGYRIAGYSLNGDGGSLLGARDAARQIARAKDGDVIIAHINQPEHAAGSGVVEGVQALQARGFDFVRLDDAAKDDGAVKASSLE